MSNTPENFNPIDPRNYGARADGTHNDGPAIQAAHAQGGRMGVR